MLLYDRASKKCIVRCTMCGKRTEEHFWSITAKSQHLKNGQIETDLSTCLLTLCQDCMTEITENPFAFLVEHCPRADQSEPKNSEY